MKSEDEVIPVITTKVKVKKIKAFLAKVQEVEPKIEEVEPEVVKEVKKVKAKKSKAIAKSSSRSEVIDMRSDTVTRPSDAMKKAMTVCAIGDDVYGDDPTVNYMEETMAQFFNKEAAIYMPSGTQSNVIAMMTNCKEKG